MHAPPPKPLNPLLSAPILPTILRLSLPNMAALTATAAVAIAETAYVGQLGTAALAGMALVFPMVMLQQILVDRSRMKMVLSSSCSDAEAMRERVWLKVGLDGCVGYA